MNSMFDKSRYAIHTNKGKGLPSLSLSVSLKRLVIVLGMKGTLTFVGLCFESQLLTRYVHKALYSLPA